MRVLTGGTAEREGVAHLGTELDGTLGEAVPIATADVTEGTYECDAETVPEEA